MTKWEPNWSESHSMISSECWISAQLLDRDIMGNYHQNGLEVVDDRMVTFYFPADENIAVEKYGQNYLHADFVSFFLEQSALARAEINDFFAKQQGSDYDSFSNAKLAAQLKAYHRLYRRLSAFFAATISFFQEIPEKEFRRLLFEKTRDQKKADEYFSLLAQSTEIDIIKREELDFLQMRFAEKPMVDVLLKHANTHPWYFFNTYERMSAIAFLEKRIREVALTPQAAQARTMEIHHEQNTLKQKQQKALKELNDAKIDYFATLFQQLGHDRLELKAVWSGSEFRFIDLFAQIAKRMELSITDLMWTVRAREITEFLEAGKMFDHSEIEKRKKIYVYWLTNGRLEFYSGEDAANVARQQVGWGKKLLETQAKGRTANPGLARGRARVIFLRGLESLTKDLISFQQGEIMVTCMTQPTMVPIAKKAAAIVTDEGGITSHAAIISRELNLPCIVGTQIATKIIQTGDLIEVDATNATVRIIEKANP